MRHSSWSSWCWVNFQIYLNPCVPRHLGPNRIERQRDFRRGRSGGQGISWKPGRGAVPHRGRRGPGTRHHQASGAAWWAGTDSLLCHMPEKNCRSLWSWFEVSSRRLRFKKNGWFMIQCLAALRLWLRLWRYALRKAWPRLGPVRGTRQLAGILLRTCIEGLTLWVHL